jgi:hypothetical protein
MWWWVVVVVGWVDVVVRCRDVIVVVFGFDASGVWSMPCVIGFSTILDSLPSSIFLRFAGFYFESLMVSKYVEICRFLCIWLTSIASVLTVWRWSMS